MPEIFLLGEAWGEKEEETGRPFVGAAGYILDGMLAQVGIRRDECYVSNVFNLRPSPNNDVINLCGPRATGIANMPELSKGKYVRNEYTGELERLYNEIRLVHPNIIIALGATASWALLHSSGIKTIRGYVTRTCPAVSRTLGQEHKVLPTYHPAAIGREWKNRVIGCSDLDKAKRESSSRDITRPNREIWIEPSLADLERFEQEYITDAEQLSVDIETWQTQITCISFAPDDRHSIVIPFCTWAEPDGNYWRTLDEELAAWRCVRKWLALKPSIFQNGVYDMMFLWRFYGIPSPLALHDTMLLHHAWQPEMEKGLGFLASVYTDEHSWKQMRKGNKHD